MNLMLDASLPAPMASAPGPSDHPVLAAALRHLLERDGDRPARWSTPAFATDVDEQRARLALAPGAARGSTASGELGFGAAVTLLATDPVAVALAVRRLERSCHRRLPSWRVLVRGGLPAAPSDLEVALWFG